MSPFPRLHHHDIMTVVGSACSGRTAPYNTSCNVGALKDSQSSACSGLLLNS